MPKKLNNTFTKSEAKLLKRVAKLCVDAVLSTPGSLATIHFRSLEKLVNVVVKQNVFGDGTTERDLNRMMEHRLLIGEKVSSHPLFRGSILKKGQLIEDAISVAKYASDIADLRDIIDQESGLQSAKKFVCSVTSISSWISLDLLNYAFNDGSPRCPDILGVILGFTHKHSSQAASCIEFFGNEITTVMFEIASPEGLRLACAPIQHLDKTLTVYRGGNGVIPNDIFEKMSWTLDIDTAVKWSSKLGDDIPYVISTVVQRDEVLATFEHESEVVIPSNPSRWIQVINIFPPKKNAAAAGSKA